MNDSEENDRYVPDSRLASIYKDVCDEDESLYESLCPSFLNLSDDEPRYSDDSLLGEGALKKVFRTYDRRTQRWIAMARLRDDRDIQYFEIFVREAWLISSLSHPNIIKIHDTGVDDDERPFFTMDLKAGRSLADLLAEPTRDVRSLLGIFCTVCDAVAYAHAHQVIHLDLKPENIQCDQFGEVLVCDWGLGKTLDSTNEEEPATPTEAALAGMTLIGQIKGSPGYMAPEQARANCDKDERTDIYSLGCILYAILTGNAPFTGNVDQILAQTLESNVQSPRLRYPELSIPESLDAVVMKALSKNPDDRYISVARLQREIHSYLTGYATRAENPGFFKEVRLLIARNRLPVAISGAFLLILMVGAALFGENLHSQRQKTEAEHRRAEQLTSTVDVLHADYKSLETMTEEANEQLARQLAVSARTLKNYGMTSQPVSTLELAEALTQMALTLDPDNTPALKQQLSNDYLKLNYEKTLQSSEHIALQKEISNDIFARQFPHYNFTKELRPRADQLVALFQFAKTIEPLRVNYFERVLAYHQEVLPKSNGKLRVLKAFIEYINGLDSDEIDLLYDLRQRTLQIETDHALTLAPRSGNCCLLALPCRSLSLKISKEFPLNSLNELLIKSLDISECADVQLAEVSLPQLRKITVRKGQFPKKSLKLTIQTDAPFDIIELTN